MKHFKLTPNSERFNPKHEVFAQYCTWIIKINKPVISNLKNMLKVCVNWPFKHIVLWLCRASSVFFLLCCVSCFRCLAVNMGRCRPTQTKHRLFLCSICMFCSWLLLWEREEVNVGTIKASVATFLWPYEADQLKETLHHAMKQLTEVLHDIHYVRGDLFYLLSTSERWRRSATY